MCKMYEIVPIKKKDMEWSHETLPKPLFRLLIIKPSGAGGSTVVSNMLSSRFPYARFFGKNIFMFSPTFKSDPVYEDSPILEKNCFDTYDESILRELYDEQKKHKEEPKGQSATTEGSGEFKENKLEHILIILDDLIVTLPSAQKNYVSHLYMSGRHMNISMIILSQSYKLISRGIRLNATHIITMAVSSNEANKMADESCADDFVGKLNKCCCKPYGWMLEDLTKHPFAPERFRDQFSSETV